MYFISSQTTKLKKVAILNLYHLKSLRNTDSRGDTMFNNPKKKLPPDAPPKAAEEKKEWKSGTYSKVLHAINPKASVTTADLLFKKTQAKEVSTTATNENKTTARPDASRKK